MGGRQLVEERGRALDGQGSPGVTRLTGRAAEERAEEKEDVFTTTKEQGLG